MIRHIKKDIQGKDYIEYEFKTDFGTLSVSVDNDGYALFTLKSNAEPTSIETYFGLAQNDALLLAETLRGRHGL